MLLETVERFLECPAEELGATGISEVCETGLGIVVVVVKLDGVAILF